MNWLRITLDWLDEIWPYSVVVLVFHWLLTSMVSQEPYGLFSSAMSYFEDRTWAYHQWGVFTVLLVPCIPLIYLYIWMKAREFLELSIESGITKTDTPPEKKQIEYGFRILLTLVGMFLVPSFLWAYTMHVEFFWGDPASFWFQRGFFLGCIISFLISFFGSKAPNELSKLSKQFVKLIDDDLEK